jgi:hypothetical protein
LLWSDDDDGNVASWLVAMNVHLAYVMLRPFAWNGSIRIANAFSTRPVV